MLSANLRQLTQVKISSALEPLTTCNPSLGENSPLVLQLSFSIQNKSVKLFLVNVRLIKSRKWETWMFCLKSCSQHCVVSIWLSEMKNVCWLHWISKITRFSLNTESENSFPLSASEVDPVCWFGWTLLINADYGELCQTHYKPCRHQSATRGTVMPNSLMCQSVYAWHYRMLYYHRCPC